MDLRVVIGVFLLVIAIGFADAQEPGCATTACHSSLLSFETVHPAAEEDCANCHEALSENDHPRAEGAEFRIADEVPALCYGCHDEKGTKKNVHPPVEDGECTTCHSPHASQNDFMLLKEDGRIICRSCHDFDNENNPVHHEPYAQDKCVSCHNPHESDNHALLNQESPNLCLNCHSEQLDMATLDVLHPPFEEDCLNCHNPHVSKVKKLLTERVPDLCFECHDDIAETVESATVKHKVLSQKKTCLNCHTPHASGQESLLVKVENKLCMKCHERSLNRRRLKRDKKAKLIQAENITVHPPVEESCINCHQAHGSVNESILASPFATGNYVNGMIETFELCFNCHDSAMLENANTGEDTEFRNGRKNLHYIHVVKEKGRNCVNCHNVHSSSFEHLIDERILFGKWQMPITYEANESGGSCLPACHELKVYSRK